MAKLTNKQLYWFNQKLKGDFAEIVCENHFNSLDYNVEKVGIEAIAPIHVRKSQLYDNNFVQEQLNKTPDFIVSNETDAFFVEVKFRNNLTSGKDFYKESADLIKRYKSILIKPEYLKLLDDKMKYKEVYDDFVRSGENKFKENVKVIFYVIVPTKAYESYVHLFLPQLITKKEYGWRSFKYKTIDDEFGIDGLKERYETLIEPFLENIFNTKENIK